jgi:hypothetical protein
VRKLLAVAARELRERWLLFPASFVFGCSPLVLPGFGVDRQVMPEVGLMTSIGFGTAAAVLMGSTMLARDASNGRLGFLFSRPVSWPAIWGGKWLAALVLVVSSGLLAAIPWMNAFPLASIGGHHGDSWIRAMLDGPRSAFVLVVFVLVVGLVNFGATAFRSRSPWSALDLVLLLAALWATRRYVAPLLLYEVLAKEQVPPTVLLLPLALGVLVGSVAQVAVGRTDVRRAHRAMSLAFWAVVGLTLTLAASYWLWARSATPAEVRVLAVSRDPSGRWIYVEGHGEHSGSYPCGLLMDTTTGRYHARPGPDEEFEIFAFGMVFSADGRFGAVPGAVGGSAALSLFDLREGTPRITRVTLESSPPPRWGTAFTLSPSAASVFVVHESGASLYALPSGRRLATTTIPPGWRPAAARYLAEGAARTWLVPSNEGSAALRARAEMRVVDLTADGSSSGTTFPTAAALDPMRIWNAVFPDAEGDRIVTGDAGLHLRDGATGDLVATLAEGPGASANPALFLADGRIVVGDSGAHPGLPPPLHARLRVFDRVGVKLADLDLPLPPWGLGVGPEVAPGRVVVSCFRSSFLSEDALVVDAASGGVVDKLPGLRPAIGFWGLSSFFPLGTAVSGVQFFRDADGRVVRIDFATGERKVVAGPGAPRGERISVR